MFGVRPLLGSLHFHKNDGKFILAGGKILPSKAEGRHGPSDGNGKV